MYLHRRQNKGLYAETTEPNVQVVSLMCYDRQNCGKQVYWDRCQWLGHATDYWPFATNQLIFMITHLYFAFTWITNSWIIRMMNVYFPAIKWAWSNLIHVESRCTCVFFPFVIASIFHIINSCVYFDPGIEILVLIESNKSSNYTRVEESLWKVKGKLKNIYL